MPGLIRNATNVTIEQLNDIVNVSTAEELFININHDIYLGWLYFVLLLTLWMILFISSQSKNDQMLNNLMYSGAIVTILSFLIRGITVVQNGVIRGLLTDHQMWIFPLITIFLAVIKWSTKE